jgi:hypothetical protein
LLLASCTTATGSSAAGDAETDRQSRTLADAIVYPHQADAAGLARAVLDTNLGKTKNFSVLEFKDLPHTRNEDPMSHLVWRIHRDADPNSMDSSKAMDACYSVDFNYWEATSGPSRIDCPKDAAAVTPAPLAKRSITSDFNPALEAALGKLPATPSEADVRAALTAGLPAPQVDPETKLASIPPDIFVQVKGADVGVALFARIGTDDKDCVLGRRVGGAVKVWSLNWRDLGPLEKPCNAEAALTGP